MRSTKELLRELRHDPRYQLERKFNKDSCGELFYAIERKNVGKFKRHLAVIKPETVREFLIRNHGYILFNGNTALHYLFENSEDDQFQEMLESIFKENHFKAEYLRPDEMVDEGDGQTTPLHLAARFNSLNMVRLLAGCLKDITNRVNDSTNRVNKENLNALDSCGHSALYYAVMSGNPALVKEFLSLPLSENLNILNADRRVSEPLLFSLFDTDTILLENKFRILELFWFKNANLQAEENGIPLLCHAAEAICRQATGKKALNFLKLEAFLKPLFFRNTTSQEGLNMALQIACDYNNKTLSALLLSEGADPASVNITDIKDECKEALIEGNRELAIKKIITIIKDIDKTIKITDSIKKDIESIVDELITIDEGRHSDSDKSRPLDLNALKARWNDGKTKAVDEQTWNFRVLHSIEQVDNSPEALCFNKIRYNLAKKVKKLILNIKPLILAEKGLSFFEDDDFLYSDKVIDATKNIMQARNLSRR